MGTTVLRNKRERMARVEKEYRALDRVVRRLGKRGLSEDVPGFGARARLPIERKNRLLYERWHSRSARTI